MKGNLSLFERIGGMSAVNKAVDTLYKKILADEKINHFFVNMEMVAQIRKMASFLAYAFGASGHLAFYSGKKMKDAHAHLHITSDQFDIVASHLVSTLQKLDIAQELIDEVVGIALSTKKDIVGSDND